MKILCGWLYVVIGWFEYKICHEGETQLVTPMTILHSGH